MAIVLLAAANAVPLPQSASIVDVPTERRDAGWRIGNVKVVFSDGHSEMWTKLGRALIPEVANSGLVGWVTFRVRSWHYGPYDDTLRIIWPDEHHCDYKADATYPYIEKWGFANQDTSVVIKARAAHGSADYLEYDLKSGKLVDHAHGLLGQALPTWAQPYSD